MAAGGWAPADPPEEVDPGDPDRVAAARGWLAEFNRAGILGATEVHAALRLGRLVGDPDPLVELGVAFAVRGPRAGHVRVDLAGLRETVTEDLVTVDPVAVDPEATDARDGLPWPDPADWAAALAASPLVTVGGDGPADRPLRLVDGCLYLDRYWQDERFVAADLLARADRPGPAVDLGVLSDGLGRLFGGPGSAEQAWAAAAAVLRPLSVIAGGPGTGKTTTVARVLALLEEQARDGAGTTLVALAAPTGKAAARMEEAVRLEAGRLAVDDGVRARLLAVGGQTIHRLLGRRPDRRSRFRHDRRNRLPHDVVIVDETSMVPLSLMARLLEAVRPDARLVLVGDPDQLASVEAGAVLGDIVGPAVPGMRMAPAAAATLREVTGLDVAVEVAPAGAPIGDGIVVLRSNHRLRGALSKLAAAVRAGDPDAVVDVLGRGDPALTWLRDDVARADGALRLPIGGAREAAALEVPRTEIVRSGQRLLAAAGAGDGPGALDALESFRVLCAHRHGPAGASSWNARIESWLAGALDDFSLDTAWYPGRPVIVTANDYGLRLFNGDTGAVVAGSDGRLGVAFRRGGSVVTVSPSRLAAVETVYATTVHKAQGSEFRTVLVVLPPAGSAILTRELLYTAVTRARERLLLVGGELSVRAAVARPIARSSGLTDRLWGPSPPGE